MTKIKKRRRLNKLQIARVVSGLSVEDVSKKIGVSKQSVYGWLSNPKRARFKKIVELCDILGVNVDDIIQREETNK